MKLEANIDFWIKNNYNVLLRGSHGTGKSAMVIDAFNRHNLKWLYFSASTLDPWADFVGVPKEQVTDNGISYLEFIKPKALADGSVEAIFLDEFNRSDKKVRNAVMELLQFKSINGTKFPNLKIVWAAINPSDEESEYDVENLDPAQEDRFHAIIDIPNTPSIEYFRNKYNDQGDVAVTWWKELPEEQKKVISPRRLDYAIDMYLKDGDISFVLPKGSNINKLMLELKSGSISKNLKSIFNNGDQEKAKEFLSNENNYSACIDYILKNNRYVDFFIEMIPQEKLASLVHKNKNVENYVFTHPNKFKTLITSLASSTNKSIKRLAQSQVNFWEAENVKISSTSKKKSNSSSQDNQMIEVVLNLPQSLTYESVKKYIQLEPFIKNKNKIMSINDYQLTEICNSLTNMISSFQVGTVNNYAQLATIKSTYFDVVNEAMSRSLNINLKQIKKACSKHNINVNINLKSKQTSKNNIGVLNSSYGMFEDMLKNKGLI